MNENKVKMSGWFHRKWGKAIIIMITLLLLLAVVFISAIFGIVAQNKKDAKFNVDDTVKQLSNGGIEVKSPARLLAEKSGRPYFGNPDAKLVIVEFSDFRCPYSAKEFPIIRSIMNKYKNDIFFISRQYPVISENSMIIAQASLCADEQGKFWQMHDKLFALSDQEISVDALKNVAQGAGLEAKQFNECLSSEKQKTKVQEDYKDGIDLGVAGTPTFFLNGRKIQGVVSADDWERVIEAVKEVANK